ncbi:hypothetical protein [Paraburkholderia sp. D1E]|uniref:hypothetical protein n=1 Tax=Paraburkholderia sp. D1E TaxID=3461398 RepID=UPI00404547BC
MWSGTTQYVLICEAVADSSQSGASDQVLCPPNGSQYFHVQPIQAYLLDPTVASSVEATLAPFDYGQAAGFWGLAFTSVVALYFVCRGIGAVVEFVRRA